MNIYVLKQLGPAGWDEYEGFVIVATSESNAREIASQHAPSEGRIWSDASKTSCDEVNDVQAGVVLAAFNAG